MLRDLSDIRVKNGFSSRAVNRMRQIQGTRMSSWAAIYLKVSESFEDTPLLHLGGSKALIRERFAMLNDWHGGYYHYLRGGTFFDDNGSNFYYK